MTGITKRVPIGQALAGVVNTDEAIADINLRLSSGGGAVYNGTHVGDGVYEFTGIESGAYKVFSAGTELSKVDWVVIGETGTILATQISGVINVANIPTLIPATRIADGSVTNAEFQTLDATSSIQTQFNTATTAINLRALDTAVMHKTGAGETVTSPKLFNGGGNIVVDGATATAGYAADLDISDNKRWITFGQLMREINAFLTGLVIPMAQQSDRLIRVIYGGTFEGGDDPRVELTINNAIASAVALTPASNKRFYIFVEKNGLEDGFGASAVASTFPDFINFSGQNNQCRIFPDDSTFTSVALGNSIIKDFTMEWGSGATATPVFTRKIFQNVVFDINDNAISFDECLFFDCYVKGTAGTYAITNCNGTPLLADELPTTITGYSPKIQITGQYNQRQLGLRGTTVASATDITLGAVGNYFRISGTTNIERMSLTGWTEGSIVTLYFEGILNVVNGASGAGHFALNGATNLTTSAGDIIQVVYDNNIWYQVAPTSLN